jgi:hypothetical protein
MTMRQPTRPAAYIRVRPGHGSLSPAQRAAILEVASRRGWPEPTIYADDGPVRADGYSPALARLSAAVGAGRHDAVIVASPGVMSHSPAHLMAFLVRCTHHGVAVEFTSPRAAPPVLMHPQASGWQSQSAPQPARPARLPAAQPPALLAGRPLAPVPPRCAAGNTEILTRAGVEALTGAFPDWRIWADDHGWHARRRGDVYLQAYRRGAPAFCVHAISAVDLAAQLRWQQAADIHAPAGCSRR